MKWALKSVPLGFTSFESYFEGFAVKFVLLVSFGNQLEARTQGQLLGFRVKQNELESETRKV